MQESSKELADACWDILLHLREKLRDAPPPGFCSIALGSENRIRFDELIDIGDGSSPTPSEIIFDIVLDVDAYPSGSSPSRPRFLLRDIITVEQEHTESLPGSVRAMMTLYGPYACGARHARSMGRALAISHFAQTLDGRIATITGDSRWIGNDDNLLHAHRMRALCDAVLVGSGTLRRDLPRLTVRRVSGNNPARVILGACENADLECLVAAGSDPIIALRCAKSETTHVNDDGTLQSVQVISFDQCDDFVPGPDVMRRLHELGLHSVYVEGGAVTTSRLLRDNVIDVVQLHISPMILGSGKDAFQLEPVGAIDASLRFDSHAYVAVDDGVMFVGVPSRYAPAG